MLCLIVLFQSNFMTLPLQVASRFKASVCGRSPAGFAGSFPAAGHRCLSLVSVVCRQVEVSTTGRSLVQRSPTECGVSECDREVSIMWRPWPIMGCCAIEKIYPVTIKEIDTFNVVLKRNY